MTDNSERRKELELEQALEACFDSTLLTGLGKAEAAAPDQGELLEQTVEAYAESISPFKDAVSRIVAGLCMTCYTLNFLGLGTILPMIGYVMIYLGLRTLRTGSGWLTAAWALSGVQLISRVVLILINASPMLKAMAEWSNVIGVTAISLEIVLLLCLGLGLQAVNRTADTDGVRSSGKNPTLPIVFWKAALLILALKGTTSWLVLIFMVVAFVYSIKCILRIGDSISDQGYEIKTRPVWIEAKAIWILTLGILVIGLTVITVTSTYTSMDWNMQRTPGSAENASSQEIAQLRTALAAKGFPEDLLADIADEDLELLIGEDIVHIEIADNERTNGEPSKVMDHRIVYVCMEDHLQAYIEFSYKDGKHSWLADGLRLNNGRDRIKAGVQGKLLCEKDGQTLIADLQTTEDSITYPWFGDLTTQYAYGAQYSYPAFSDDQRGYITWTTDFPDAAYNFDVYRQKWPIRLNYQPLVPELQGGFSFGMEDKAGRLSIYDTFWLREVLEEVNGDEA